jgi:hypothetical protein
VAIFEEIHVNSKVAIVLNGFEKLDAVEKDEFVSELNKRRSGKSDELRKSLTEAQRTTMNLGPMPTGCPCCGR